MSSIGRLMLLSLVGLLSFASVAFSQTAVEWKVSDGGNGHRYLRVDLGAEISWTSANSAAKARGGNLVSINSKAEQTWLFSNLVVGFPTCAPASWAYPRSAWIGLFQDRSAPNYSEPAGAWKWTSGEPTQFTNWAPNEPNNVDYPADYAAMYVDGLWDDTPNDAGIYCVTAYIVEFEPDCNADGIADPGQILSGDLPDQNGNGVPDCCESGAPCPRGPNLVNNGSLEGYTNTCAGFWTIGSGSTAIPGWTVSGSNNIDWAADSQASCCPAVRGIAFVDLNGSPSQSMGSALRQSIATQVGKVYEMSASVVVNNCCHQPGQQFAFRMTAGSTMQNFTLTVPSGPSCQYWQRVSMVWIASGTSTAIEVRSMVPNSAGGILVDDIHVHEYPALMVPAQFPTIQNAVNAASTGDQVIVAEGTYREAVDLKGKAVTLKAAGARANTILDGTGLTGSVIRATSGETSATLLQGFTIRNGTAGSLVNGQRVGGGMLVQNASPTIRDCAFVSNSAQAGGGLAAINSQSLIDGCTFSTNTAETGGGLWFDGGRPTVSVCVATGNSASGHGGGLYATPMPGQLPNAVLIGNTLCSNTSADAGRENLWALFDDGGNSVCDCFGDVDGNDIADPADISLALLWFGSETDPEFIQPDQDMNGTVDTGDISVLLLIFGPCPG